MTTPSLSDDDRFKKVSALRAEPSAHAQNSSGHELRDGLLHLRILVQSLVRSLWVLLHLLQEHLDLWVVQNLLDLRIRHGVSHLLLINLAATAALLDLRQDLLAALEAFVVGRFDLQAVLVRLQSLVVLLHEE